MHATLYLTAENFPKYKKNHAMLLKKKGKERERERKRKRGGWFYVLEITVEFCVVCSLFVVLFSVQCSVFSV